ncbi:MAG: J domain-containing protein [Spirochaetota bacterium]
MKSYYDILKVNVASSPDQIKRAFRKRAKELHPDVNRDLGDTVEAMQSLLRAYETLIDPDRREEYDRRMMILRPEVRFDYREFLRSRPEDDEFQAKLVFFDLLHHNEHVAVELYDSLRARGDFALCEHLDREDYMDCAYLLAEEYERRQRYSRAFELLTSVIAFELERPYFKHFFVEVTDKLRTLVCFKMPATLSPEEVIEFIDEALLLDISHKDLAFFLKKGAELYADVGDVVTATAYLQRGLEMDGKLPGTKKLRDRLSALRPA